MAATNYKIAPVDIDSTVQTRRCTMHRIEKAMQVVEDIEVIIEMVRDTVPEAWQLDVVRSEDGSRNCFFGHLFAWAERTAEQHSQGADPEAWANDIWSAFEERWATTYAVYPVNDGSHPRYQQPTARERVLALLEALRDGREPTTKQAMEADYQASLAAEISA